MSKIIILGDGLLGSELRKQTGWDYISRKKDGFDFCVPLTYQGKIHRYDTVVNCIAVTDTYSPYRGENWDVNYVGVMELANYCDNRKMKLVQISTDYVYANSVHNASEDDLPCPAQNWYTLTKLLSDAYVQAACYKHLIVRTSFKPRPFPYYKVVTQQGNFDYVDVIAGLIVKLIDGNAQGVYNVGTTWKTMRGLARQTLSRDIIYSVDPPHSSFPLDVSMNLGKLNRFLEEYENKHSNPHV